MYSYIMCLTKNTLDYYLFYNFDKILITMRNFYAVTLMESNSTKC